MMKIVIYILSFISLFTKKNPFTHLFNFFSKEKKIQYQQATIISVVFKEKYKTMGDLPSIRSLTWQNYGLVWVFKKAKESQALSSAIAGTIKAKERNEKEEEEEDRERYKSRAMDYYYYYFS